MTAQGDDRAPWRVVGRLLASHTDREQVIGTLKTHVVEGRLTGDEFVDGVSLASGRF